VYFGLRWYDPDTGRWLSRDPIEEAGGLNLYAYAGNNPVNFIDPIGLADLINDSPYTSEFDPDDVFTGGGHHGKNARHVKAEATEAAIDVAVGAAQTVDAVTLDPTDAIKAGFWFFAWRAGKGKAAREVCEVAAKSGVRFGQQGVSATFRHGEFAGRTIEDVAAGLRSGAIKAEQLPIQTITRDGVSYTVNNRSLMALRQAGLEPTVIKDVTGNAFFERQLTERLAEMGGQVAPDFVPVVRGAR
jgi:uncharacterized protein RhaS with RHS repeats